MTELGEDKKINEWNRGACGVGDKLLDRLFWLKTEGDGEVKEIMPALITADLRPVMGLLFPPLGGRRRQTKHREDT